MARGLWVYRPSLPVQCLPLWLRWRSERRLLLNSSSLVSLPWIPHLAQWLLNVSPSCSIVPLHVVCSLSHSASLLLTSYQVYWRPPVLTLSHALSESHRPPAEIHADPWSVSQATQPSAGAVSRISAVF